MTRTTREAIAADMPTRNSRSRIALRRHVHRILLCAATLTFAVQADAQEPPPATNGFPERYILDYPAADRACPPVRSTFAEADRTFTVVRGRRIRHKPNGGYGLPVVDQIDGQNLLHVGADLGWHQVGEPVFAVAGGVVRFSSGPLFETRGSKPSQRPGTMAWGNLIVIEHRSVNNQYVTTLYGHLGTDRRVNVGDVVTAGQQIGTIGRKHFRINGGYTPHLHFGVREGRNAEIDTVLLRAKIDGRQADLVITEVTEESVKLRVPEGLGPRLLLRVMQRRFDVEVADKVVTLPATVLWQIERPGFPRVGYALSTDGWRDPIRFLREQQADTNPAPLRPQSRRSR